MAVRDQIRRVLRWLTFPALISGLVAFPAQTLPSLTTAAIATTITVTTTRDALSTDGFCSLREAVITANKNLASSSSPGECLAGSGVDTIVLPAGTYTLTRTDNGKEDSASTGDLDVTQSLNIVASGPAVIDAVRGYSDRIFHVLAGTLDLSGLTVSGGATSAQGGAIYNKGTLILHEAAIVGNRAAGEGGGLANFGSATLTNVTFSGNSSRVSGGGIYNSGTLSLVNVTLANNTANSDANATGDGGGLARAFGTTTALNTLIGGNFDLGSGTVHPDCSGALSSSVNNLIQRPTGCSSTPASATNLLGIDPLIGPLAANGGNTPTHALASGSPAVDAGRLTGCPPVDQRGVTRPVGASCDIGAYESEQPVQRGPVFTVTGTGDGSGACTSLECTLRAAILAANSRPNGATPDQILFDISPAGPVTIPLLAPLPQITDGLIIDGTTQPGGPVTLDGSAAGAGSDGLGLATNGVTVRGLVLRRFQGNGVEVVSGSGNRVQGMSFSELGSLPIDLGADGPTPNDAGDGDSGPNGLQNAPVMLHAVPDGVGVARVEARLNSAPSATYSVEYFVAPSCSAGGAGEVLSPIGSQPITTDAGGNAYFQLPLPGALGEGAFVRATATGPDGSTSELSECLRTGPANTSWPTALLVTPAGTPGFVETSGYLDALGQSRWFKFSVQPGARLIATLTGLPANYDLTVYKDIKKAFKDLTSPEDLLQLGAEFAPDAFSPDAFSPDAFSPDAFSPDAFSPDAFSPDAFSPDAFSPDAFSPDAFSPDAFSPDAFSPDAFSPDAFSPDAFSPDAFSPDAFSPDAFSPDAFSSAQSRSLLAVSAFEGTAGEGIVLNTWNNDGEYYVRVKGRNGAFDQNGAFRLQVTELAGVCEPVSPVTTPSSLSGQAGGYHTIVLTNLARMEGDPADKAALQLELASFAARPEVAGVVVDVMADAQVAAAFDQSGLYPTCPFAVNETGQAIRGIISRFAALNPLEYIVIVGNDDVIPFFRHPDQAQLANESNFVPPVKDATTSQASLRLGYVLSQVDYGASLDVSAKDDLLPVAGLAVGRLVETAAEATGLLRAYLATADGTLPAPTSALVTGYDFLEDAAVAVRTELQAGIGAPIDSLITPRTASPLSPEAWTADQLRLQLLERRHDVTFLAGHFSASSALAADFTTRLTTADLIASPVNLTNALIYSAGCHSGYNTVNSHGVPLVTVQPDWAQAFARKGAILIAGTGYQYGDTDFLEYSERLYLEFTRQLRSNGAPVAIGKALAAAQRAYLADSPQLRGIHEKAYLESTLFGLPMFKLPLAGQPVTPPVPPAIPAPAPVATGPGAVLGLETSTLSVSPVLTQQSVLLKDVGDLSTVMATYLRGQDGVFAAPAEPVLPLHLVDVSGIPNILRGVGLRGGTYSEIPNAIPLIGAATTEVRGVHSPFPTDVYYPVRPWSINYFDALAGGPTRLVLTPAQFLGGGPASLAGTWRTYSQMDLKLYWSDNFATYGGGSVPALSDAPDITSVSAVPVGSRVDFAVRVTGNPAAGVQEVWVTYTDVVAPLPRSWQSLDLEQDLTDSTRWTASLPLGELEPGDVRFIVQAVNGVGLVALDAHKGSTYVPGEASTPTIPTQVNLIAPPASGAYGTQATFTAELTAAGAPLAGEQLVFGIGPQSKAALTGADGRATVILSLLGLPGNQEVKASFAGRGLLLPSTTTAPFEITKQGTSLSLAPNPATAAATSTSAMVATLVTATGRSLPERPVLFAVAGAGGAFQTVAITDFAGRASLGPIPLPAGIYAVTVSFGSVVTVPSGSIDLVDSRYGPSVATGTLNLTVNQPPSCSAATPSISTIWPPSGALVPISIMGVSDPDGEPYVIRIDAIFQDERVGSGTASPDGFGIGTDTAVVRAERDGNGDGRVYHIYFRATDRHGARCDGEVRVGTVPHDQGGSMDQADGGPLYDSTIPD